MSHSGKRLISGGVLVGNGTIFLFEPHFLLNLKSVVLLTALDLFLTHLRYIDVLWGVNGPDEVTATAYGPSAWQITCWLGI